VPFYSKCLGTLTNENVHSQPARQRCISMYAGVGPFLHRGKEIILGKREINNFNLIKDDVFCPEASEWDCNEIFECTERVAKGSSCVRA
jgi:hypothetical protein